MERSAIEFEEIVDVVKAACRGVVAIEFRDWGALERTKVGRVDGDEEERTRSRRWKASDGTR